MYVKSPCFPPSIPICCMSSWQQGVYMKSPYLPYKTLGADVPLMLPLPALDFNSPKNYLLAMWTTPPFETAIIYWILWTISMQNMMQTFAKSIQNFLLNCVSILKAYTYQFWCLWKEVRSAQPSTVAASVLQMHSYLGKKSWQRWDTLSNSFVYANSLFDNTNCLYIGFQVTGYKQ